MNNVLRAMIEIPAGIMKASLNNFFYRSHISLFCAISPIAEITINCGAKVKIGSAFRARGGTYTCTERCIS